MKCPKCDWENKDGAIRCALCNADMSGEPAAAACQGQQAGQPSQPSVGQQYSNFSSGQYQPGGPAYSNNTSGGGSTVFVPLEVRGWNWGAFLLGWIWAIANRTWIGLLALVPYIGVIMWVVLGVKGNEWAWQNRRWDSVEQFKATQRVWAYWGLAMIILSFIFGLLLGVLLPVFVRARHAAQMY
ncbi:MAG: hypothetical protein ABFD49_02610 [Armatimonadota bacterium]|nr:hypothetical protein [bacterium]